MHSLRKDLIKLKNEGFKKMERKRKEKGRNRKFLRKPFHKYHEESPRQLSLWNHQTDFESVIFSLWSLKKYVAVWVL